MYKLVGNLLTIALVISATYSTGLITSRIANGIKTKIDIYPFTVFLYNKTIRKSFCGGTLITPKCILTAAHCVLDKNLDEVNVREGQTKNTLLKKAKVYRIEAIAHPLYEGETIQDADIGVIRLDEPMSSPLVELDFSPLEKDDNFTVVGWGRNEHMRRVKHLRKAFQKFVPMDECKERLKSRAFMLTNKMFCAFSRENSDTCIGDSGGPALRKGKQVGVTSWGPIMCGDPGQPAVYVRLGDEIIRKFISYALNDYCKDDNQKDKNNS